MKIANRDDLMRILTAYEGAVGEVERDGNENAIPELEKAREDLMDLLQQAKVSVEA